MDKYNFISILPSEHDEKILLSNGEDTIEVPKIIELVVKKFQLGKEINVVREEVFTEKNVDIDVEDFLKNLEKIGFLENKNKKVNPRLANLGKLLNGIFFSKVCYLIILISVIIAIYLFNMDGYKYYINYNYLFVNDSTTLSILTYFVVSWLSVFMHELTHFLSAAGFNAYAYIGLGTRLQFLVAQTTVSNPYRLVKAQRIKIYSIGMLTDVIVALACIMLVHIIHVSIIVSILRCLLYIKLSAIIWQFLFYMRTDVYYLFTTIVGEYNLMEDARLFLTNRVEGATKVVKLYSLYMLLGRIITVGYFIVFNLPLIYMTIEKILNSPLRFDSIISSMILIFPWMIFILTFIKNKYSKRRMEV